MSDRTLALTFLICLGVVIGLVTAALGLNLGDLR